MEIISYQCHQIAFIFAIKHLHQQKTRSKKRSLWNGSRH